MTLEVIGLAGSPYTRKFVAALRYRRIPHVVEWRDWRRSFGDRIAPKPVLMPTVYFPDDPQPRTDTTPLLAGLEATHVGRSLVPNDPALALIGALVEDYADEWLTKAMFHYRWRYAPDIETASHLIAFWAAPTLAAEHADAAAKEIADRQISRLTYVGSNEVTGPLIEAGYRRFLELLDTLIARDGYVLGGRPSAADFALYGQLTQLTTVDPTPAAVAAEVSFRIRAWVERMEDLSGLAPGAWAEDADALSPLLAEIGRVYAPLLLANDAALAAGEDRFEAEIDGEPWAQATFPYHRKCLAALQDGHAALGADDRARFDGWIAGSGCEALFA